MLIKSKPFFMYKLKQFWGFLAAMLVFASNYTEDMRALRAANGAIFASENVDFKQTVELFQKYNAAPSSTSMSVDGRLSEELNSGMLSVHLLNTISIASTRLYSVERADLIPCGDAIGISIYSDGVLVVGFGELTDQNGRSCCPARECGLKPGDVITGVNGRSVCTSNELQLALEAIRDDVRLNVERDGSGLSLSIRPVADSRGTRRIGAWVRDSTIGIGTLSFIDPKPERLAALGHSVSDADTLTVLPVLRGYITAAEILGVVKGVSGAPGELKGTFSSRSEAIGSVDSNGAFGIFGKLAASDANGAMLLSRKTLPLAFPNEVKTGEAFIRSQISDEPPQLYSCRIIRTVKQKGPEQKGLVIEITDERLLEATGGIVQGMSGSPIIQDGRLVGVLTHVFVNDPKKGYGIYAFWMHSSME